MDYEIVQVSQKTLVGLSARTANLDPQMGQVIGGLWQRLFGEGVPSSIPNKSTSCTIGLYSGYENGALGQYDITVGCEVTRLETAPSGLVVKTIPEGRYAKFVALGGGTDAVGALWQKIWVLPLERTFTGDFEEYFPAPDGKPGEVHIYIAVK